VTVDAEESARFVLSDEKVQEVARLIRKIAEHYRQKKLAYYVDTELSLMLKKN